MRIHLFEACSTVYDKVRAGAPFLVGEWARKELLEFLGRHVGPRQHAVPLHFRWRTDDDGHVDTLLGARLEQEWDLEHSHLSPLPLLLTEEIDLGFDHHGMHDALELPQALRVARHLPGEQFAIDPSFACDTGKGRLDRCDRVSFIESMDAGIGIEHRNATVRKMRGSRRLAHANSTAKPNDQH